jgi:hypothetical protein
MALSEAELAKIRYRAERGSEQGIGSAKDMLLLLDTIDALRQELAEAKNGYGLCERHLDTTIADANVNDPCPLCSLETQLDDAQAKLELQDCGHPAVQEALERAVNIVRTYGDTEVMVERIRSLAALGKERTSK